MFKKSVKRISMALLMLFTITKAQTEDSLTNNERAQKIAEKARPAIMAAAYVKQQIAKIRNPQLRRLTEELITNPAPTYQAKAPLQKEHEQVLSELRSAGLITAEVSLEGIYIPVKDPTKAAQSFLAAPGSYYRSAKSLAGHHSYPGGLAVHTAYNLRAGLSMIENYKRQYPLDTSGSGFSVDPDLVICGIVLHDIMKTLVFQWKKDGSLYEEQQIAGTGAHHILGIAEMYVRGFPAEAVIAMASAHDPTAPSPLRKKVVSYLRAAAIIARVDPVSYGTLKAKDDELDIASEARPEHFIVHLSDADYHYSGHAAAATVGILRELAKTELGWSDEALDGERFNWLRNQLLASHTEIGLYQLYLKKGSKALLRLISSK